MSVLKTSQAQANEKFFFREQNNNSTTDEFLASHRTTNLNSVAASQAFHSSGHEIKGAAAPSKAAVHTAMRMKQRKERKLELHLSSQEQDQQ